MAIKDLQRNTPGLARAGVIRLGYKLMKCQKCGNVRAGDKCPQCKGSKLKKTRNGDILTFPTQADHFVLTDAPGVTEALGNPKPKELRIYFPFDEIDQVFPAYHQNWVASALVCRGDGEHILYAINPQSGEIIVRDGQAITDCKSKDGEFEKGDYMTCPGMSHDTYTRCQHCKPNAILVVLLRDVPRLAYYQIATASIHNIVNLTEQLTYIKQSVGRLQGVPFILKLTPQNISVPKSGGNGRMRTEKHLLSLEVDPEWVQQLMDTKSQLATPARRLLPAPDEADVIDIEPEPQPEAAMEPVEWFPPNGNDDSEFLADDWQAFVDRVLANIPYYETVENIAATMDILLIAYDPENEDFLYDQLARHAQSKADLDLARQEADGILMANQALSQASLISDKTNNYDKEEAA